MSSRFQYYLKIHVIAGKNLKSADSNGFSDPYAVVVLGKQKFKTNVVKKSLNPIWEEGKFTASLTDPEHDRMHITVFDKDMLKSDYLGEVDIPLTNLQQGVEMKQWYKLNNISTGEIQVALTAVNFGAKLEPAVGGAVQHQSPQLQPQPQPGGYPMPHPTQAYPAPYYAPSPYAQFPPAGFATGMPYPSSVPGPYPMQAYGAPPMQYAGGAPVAYQQMPPSPVQEPHTSKAMLNQNATESGWKIRYEELRFEKKIGSGGFGEVWKGEWIGTTVAIKKIMRHDIREEDLQEFTSEILLMTKLRHPNVIQFLGACMEPEFCLITEFMGRGSLFHVLGDPANQIHHDWVLKIKIALDVSKGILYLHSRDPIIIHRDIKSLNVLVSDDWKAVVSDFGLTKIKTAAMLSTRCGSPAWSAPEVLRGQPYNERADIYSYGIVLWEIISGQPPYKGMDPNVVIGQVGFQNPPLRPPIPECPYPGMLQLMQQCWQDDPFMRPDFHVITSALKQLLHAAQQGQLPVAPPVGAASSSSSPSPAPVPVAADPVAPSPAPAPA